MNWQVLSLLACPASLPTGAKGAPETVPAGATVDVRYGSMRQAWRARGYQPFRMSHRGASSWCIDDHDEGFKEAKVKEATASSVRSKYGERLACDRTGVNSFHSRAAKAPILVVSKPYVIPSRPVDKGAGLVSLAGPAKAITT